MAPIITTPLIINFTCISTGNPLGWLWDFGDTTSSNLQNPTHTYTNPGIYNVNYVEIHSNGANKTSMQTITVTNSMFSAIMSAYGLIIGISVCICILLIISCILSLFVA